MNRSVHVLAAVLIFASFLLSAWAIRSAISKVEEARFQACLVGNETRAAITDVFKLFEIAVAENDPNRSVVEKRQADKFFTSVYHRVAPHDCEEK